MTNVNVDDIEVSQFTVNNVLRPYETKNGNKIWIRNIPIGLATILAEEEIAVDSASRGNLKRTRQDKETYGKLLVEVLESVIKDEKGRRIGIRSKTHDGIETLDDKTGELILSLWDIDYNNILSIARGADTIDEKIAEIDALTDKLVEAAALTEAEKKE